jgi:hypothetical protein
MKREEMNHRQLFRANLRLARSLWPGQIDNGKLNSLRALSGNFQISVAAGDLQLLDGRWYVTHSGLIRLSKRNRCLGIRVQALSRFCDPSSQRWMFKATVYTTPRSKGFAGYGDADPSNVSSIVRGAEMRVAETRAVNRALRKAYGIGLCSVEELGSPSGSPTSSPQLDQHMGNRAATFSNNDHHPRLRDQLCLLIRQHSLDPTLVKFYAADYCGTQTLKAASRDLVESFISHVAKAAKEDRDALVCKLNSYAQPKEANP